MTIRHLKIFVEVYRSESMTHAAQHLYMAQPAVSRAIQELETYYETKLFERMNRRLSPTEAGKRLYSHAVNVLDSFDQMETELHGWDETACLRVGATISIGAGLLPDLVLQFEVRCPKAGVHAVIANSQSLQEKIKSNDLDIAMIEGVVTDPDLHAEPFREDRLILIVNRDHPLRTCDHITLKRIVEFPLLLREKGSAGRDFLDHLFSIHNLPLNPQWESTSTQALVNAVSKGIGISILPDMLVKDAVARGEVFACDVEGDELSRVNNLVWHKQKYLSSTMQAWISMCKETQEAI